MRNRRLTLRVAAGVTFLALVAAACGSSKKSPGANSGGSSSTTAPVSVPQGGQLVIGAEQQPDCVAWILSCAGSSWGYWMLEVGTMPRAFDTVKEGDKWVTKPNAMLTGEPTLDTTNASKPVVTYKINPAAKWSDNTAISCDDFAFTWDAIANGKDIYDPTGYVDIEKVDCPDPQTAVVTYKKVYSGWKGLFGGGFGILPSHLLKGKSIQTEMANGYKFSAGPWMLDRWTKDVEMVLVPNPNWWGADKPKLDKVTFRFQADTAAEFQAFKANEVSVIYPQPQPDAVNQIKAGLEGAQSQYSAQTGNLEALWINNAAFPFDDVKVRQAFAYAIDRTAIVKALFGALGVDQPMQTLNPPILSDFSDTAAWSGYAQQLDKVTSLMEGAGWTKTGGVWTKGGKQATVVIKSTQGNKRREITVTELINQLGAAGFKATFNPQNAGDLFGKQLPAGDFQVALYAQVLTFISPGQCSIFCAKNIPSAANKNAGQNWTRTNVTGLDAPLEKIDGTLDEAQQKAAGKEADKIEADNMVSLPIDPLPNILLWKNSVVGPVSDNPVLGPFVDMDKWGVKA